MGTGSAAGETPAAVTCDKEQLKTVSCSGPCVCDVLSNVTAMDHIGDGHLVRVSVMTCNCCCNNIFVLINGCCV